VFPDIRRKNMKRVFFAFIAVLTVFAMVMMGCDSDSGSTTEEGDDIKVEGETLVHTSPKLDAANRWGGTPGVANADGSYTFDGTSAQYNGDGAQYNFPAPKAGDTWKLSDYGLFEIHFKTISGRVQGIVKKGSVSEDFSQFPSGNNYPDFNAEVDDGVLIFRALIANAGTGIGIQRNQYGPATVKIEKVIFSRLPKFTISFSGGDYAAMPAIPSIEVVAGQALTIALMPPKPTRPDYTFTGWMNGDVMLEYPANITKDTALVAQWEAGAPPVVETKLDLNVDWDALPPCPALTGAFTPPAYYATPNYNATTGVLTLTFDGINRQRAIIPLTPAQTDLFLWTTESGVTFKIDATIVDDTGAVNPAWAGFRYHLGTATEIGNWNATDTIAPQNAPLHEHLVKFTTWSGNRYMDGRLGYFILQAMCNDEDGSADTVGEGFPKVTITINSITVEPGDTAE
jgi:uncharacterized repeat protein (TIGR02543 family)